MKPETKEAQHLLRLLANHPQFIKLGFRETLRLVEHQVVLSAMARHSLPDISRADAKLRAAHELQMSIQEFNYQLSSKRRNPPHMEEKPQQVCEYDRKPAQSAHDAAIVAAAERLSQIRKNRQVIA